MVFIIFHIKLKSTYFILPEIISKLYHSTIFYNFDKTHNLLLISLNKKNKVLSDLNANIHLHLHSSLINQYNVL
jgi:hypothetical protein